MYLFMNTHLSIFSFHWASPYLAKHGLAAFRYSVISWRQVSLCAGYYLQFSRRATDIPGRCSLRLRKSSIGTSFNCSSVVIPWCTSTSPFFLLVPSNLEIGAFNHTTSFGWLLITHDEFCRLSIFSLFLIMFWYASHTHQLYLCSSPCNQLSPFGYHREHHLEFFSLLQHQINSSHIPDTSKQGE